MSSILNEIAAYKREWVAACKQRFSEVELLEFASVRQPMDFAGALVAKVKSQQTAVIAEVKKASPSKGIIRKDFDPVSIAKSYEVNGAACLSVLTDVRYFQGADQYVHDIRQHVQIPILRKEFIVDPYQIIEAKAMGADAILVIMAMVDDETARDQVQVASELGLSVLPEVHNAEELERAMKLDTPLMGINNRNLHTFETSLETTISLLSDMPADKTVITESGIFTHADVALMQGHGVYGFLVGESLMRQADPGLALQDLLGSA